MQTISIPSNSATLLSCLYINFTVDKVHVRCVSWHKSKKVQSERKMYRDTSSQLFLLHTEAKLEMTEENATLCYL